MTGIHKTQFLSPNSFPMPELPEVQTVVSELNRKLKNRIIKTVEVRASKVIAIGPKTLPNIRSVGPKIVKKFIKTLKGQKVLSVKRRAKLIIIDLAGPWTLLVHLKMTGQFIFEDRKLLKKSKGYYRILNRKTAPKILHPAKHTHVVFYFSDDARLYFNDVRKFGYMKLVHDDEINQVRELAEFGPEPLDKIFTLDLLKRFIKSRPKLTIKQYLMDPTVVAGIGNIYSDEILFHAKVRPERKLSTIKTDEWRKIFAAIAPVLKKGIAAKGSSVGDFVRTDGSWGQMGKFHYVYGRKGQKCKVCGTIIKSLKIGGRTGSFCPRCQK